jgi:hypothetical protein
MNERASLQIETSKRGPPKRASVYRQQPIERTISLTDSEREIARAIAEIKRLDELMTTLETRIDDYDERLSDPDQDGWDVIDIQNNRDRMQGARNQASFDLMQAVNTVIFHGGLLIDAWHETKLENIGLQHSQCDPFYRRVQDEWPKVATDPVWQRFMNAGVPF